MSLHKMEKYEGFLDDTSISKTPKSPLQTSTATKDMFKRPSSISRNVQDVMNSYISQDGVQALNEVTNIPNFISSKFDHTRASVDTDANSSLGILQMDHFSDMADNSLSVAENISKMKRKSKKMKKSSGQNKESLKANQETVLGAKSVISEMNEEVCKDSSSDIEYDGTNISELNFDSDAGSLFAESSRNPRENRNQENTTDDKTSQSFDVNIEKMRSEMSTDSVFQTFEPSYNTLLQQLTQDRLTLENKTSNVPSLSNLSYVDSALKKETIDEESFLQNVEKLSQILSIKFCPEEISAQSSSSRSVSEPTFEISSNLLNDSVFQKTTADSKNFVNEDLKKILSGSWETKSEEMVSQESTLKFLDGYKDSSIDFKSMLPEKDVPCSGRESSSSSCNFGLGKISNETNSFLSSSQLGISDSEFIRCGIKAIELFKKEEELMKQKHMFELADESASRITNQSLASETSTTSWSTESQNVSPERCQLSIGAILGIHTENLGTLSEDSNRERPYFGTSVSTPPKDLSQHSSVHPSISEDLSSTTAVSTCKDETLNDAPVQDNEEKDKFRYSVLSQIFSEVSTSRPSTLASKIFEKCLLVDNNSIVKAACISELEEYAEKESENHNFTPICSRTTQKQDAKGHEIDDHATSSLNITLIESHPSKDITLLSELNLPNSGRNEKNSDGTMKYKTCPNCQCFLQNVTSSERPSSCCSTESIPINIQNVPREPCCMTAVSARSFSNSHNCLRSGMFYNTCSLYGTMPPQVLNYPAFQTLPGNLPGYQLWHLQGTNGFGAIQGPNELQFPEKISIGDTQKLKLTVRNKQNLPCLYQISCVSASINDLPVSIDLAGVHFPAIVQCVDGNSTDIQINLTPKYEGKIQVNLQIAASFTPSDPSFSSLQDMSLKTTIEYESLRPSISISSKDNTYLNMGPVIAGSTVVEYITIENCNEVTVPLCLTLSGDIKDHRLYFGLNQMKHQVSMKANDYRILSPKVMFYRLPQSRGNSQQSHLEIPIIFEAGKSNMDANFTMTASLENPIVNEALAFLNISAYVRINELVLADPSQNPVYFHIKDESVLKKSLTVKNQGSLPVTYDIQIEGDTNSLSVSPSTLTLKPMESTIIYISFLSSLFQGCKSSLKAAAQPYGKVFTLVDIIPIPKKVDNFHERLSLPRILAHSHKEKYVSKNIIEVNKKYLAFGGLDVGCYSNKTFTMRNTSNKSIQVKLFVKELSQSFHILNHQNEKLQFLTLDFDSKEEKRISVQFSPTKVVLCSGLLGMKPVLESGKLTFSIPLSGYGGTGKLKVLGVPEKEGIGYCLDICAANGKITYNNLTVQNTGVRAIFVKIFVSGEHSARQVSIHPSEFVLLENENKTLFVSCNFSQDYFSWNASNYGIISVIYGDELMRQQLRKLATSITSVDPVPGINFNIHYEGEERVVNDPSYRSSPKDASLFATNLKKAFVHMNLVDQDSSFSRVNFDALSTVENSYASLMGESSVSSRRLTTIVQSHSPPVKEFIIDKSSRLSMPQQLFPSELSCTITGQEGNLSMKEKECWIVKPEELTLDATCKDNRVLLINLTQQDLKFRVECAIEVISISPLWGVLPAKGQIGLRMVIIPYSHNKLSEDYNGYLKVFCGGTEKSVHVKVLQDQKRRKDLINSTAKNLDAKLGELKSALMEETSNTALTNVPSDSSLLQSVPIQNISDFPKVITLTDVVPGGTSETIFNFQNTENNSVDWDIQPMSMMFSESLEHSLWKATVFQITPSSGTLDAMETASVKITFSPPSLDHYSQFFEFSLKLENGMQKCNFKIDGKGVINNLPETANQISCTDDEKSVSSCNPKKVKKGVYLDSELCNFPSTVVGETTKVHITLKNNSNQDVKLNIMKPKAPFVIKQSSVVVRSKKFLKIPVSFKPTVIVPYYEDSVVFSSQEGLSLTVKLKGICI